MKLGKINIVGRLMNAGGAVGGGLAAAYLANTALPKISDTIDAKTGNLIILGASIFGPGLLPKRIQSKNRDLITSVAAGMQTVAGLNLMDDMAPGQVEELTGAAAIPGVNGARGIGNTSYAYQDDVYLGVGSTYALNQATESVGYADERDAVGETVS